MKPFTVKDVPLIRREVADVLRRRCNSNLDKCYLDNILIIICEILANAIEHGVVPPKPEYEIIVHLSSVRIVIINRKDSDRKISSELKGTPISSLKKMDPREIDIFSLSGRGYGSSIIEDLLREMESKGKNPRIETEESNGIYKVDVLIPC